MSTEVGTQLSTYGEEIPPVCHVLLYGKAIGFPLEVLAEQANMPLAMAQQVLDSPLMKERLGEIEDELSKLLAASGAVDAVDKELKSAELRAARKLSALLDSGTENSQLKAAMEILKINGRRAPDQVKVEHEHTIQLPERQARLLTESLAMVQSSPVVDVEAEIRSNDGDKPVQRGGAD